MINLINILLIVIILIVLNYIKIKKTIKYNEPFIDKVSLNKQYDLLYGKEQYITKNIPEPKYIYQNIDFLNKNNELELSKQFNFNYNEKEIIDTFQKESKCGVVAASIVNDPIHLPSKTEPLGDQKMMYDYQLEEPSKRKLEKIIKYEDINFDDKSIHEVYNDLIIDYKKINPKKNIKNENINKKINGGFGESALSFIDWNYEDDDEQLGYIPNESLHLAL